MAKPVGETALYQCYESMDCCSFVGLGGFSNLPGGIKKGQPVGCPEENHNLF